MDKNMLRSCILFQGLIDSDLKDALFFFHAQQIAYKKGEFLNQYLHPLPRFGLVLTGRIQVHMDEIDGYPVIMASVGPGETFGESLCFLQQNTPLYIRAETDAEVLWLSPEEIWQSDAPASVLGRELIRRFIAMLATRTLSMNDRIQILSRKRLRSKLIVFFSQYAQRSGPSFLIPFDRNSMAIYLGTERSALSRELSKMQEEGILRFNKNHFEILMQMNPDD